MKIMSKKFTPGPWNFKQYKKGCYGVGIPATDDQIALMDWHPEFDKEAHANAALISAAPDLLEALEWLVSAIHEPEISAFGLQKCYDAIKKANNEHL